MNGVTWESVIAVLGLAVPVAAALWEFFLAGRKRLGYRVQMDTTARDSATSSGPEAGILRRMQWDGADLRDPSVVLLRIENAGWSPIVEDDYMAPANDPVGIRVAFPGRRVVGMVVTECSHTVLRDFFAPGTPGFRATDGVIRLPKVKLNRRAHYKVLAVLDRLPDFTETDFPDPEITAGVVGGVRGGTIRRTEYYPFASRPVRWLLAVLIMVSVTQSVSAFTRDGDARAAPLDCAEGTLYLSGSTAFEPVLKEAAQQYTKTCPGARIPVTEGTFDGSVPGLDALAAAGEKHRAEEGLGDRLAFSDGPKADGRPQLLPRPVALSLFTLVVDEDTGVRDLSLDQVRRILAGEITDWSQVKGRPLPVQLIGRHPGSGTRAALQKQVLDGRPLLATTVDDCAGLDPKTPGRCETRDTPLLLKAVASTPGALGYSEAALAAAHEGVRPVRIDGYPATLEGADQGAYPYWETEIAYTYGEPPAGSLAASFLRYLSDEVGKDIIRAKGHRPCSELDKPLLCRPDGD
ncbi:substrate-binding domain-containing protein [Streptomyces sp. NPDC006367]|uniref:substrate-binding domain-containing protein n=1 Tax=unclassified Streptomyces TaxID=2593676 RepID=UPI0033A0E96B